MIKQCRVCKGKKLRYALKIKTWIFVICQGCTLLQRQDDVPYEINFEFEGRVFALDYYPFFLATQELDCVTEQSVMFFSLKAIDYLLQNAGYKPTGGKLVGVTLYLQFEQMTFLEKLTVFETGKRLDNQFTYFLWALKIKR